MTRFNLSRASAGIFNKIWGRTEAQPQGNVQPMFNTKKDETQYKRKYDRIHVVNREPERVTIADLIANPPEGSVKMTITPELAQEMLAFNAHNRPAAESTIRHYARQMKSGDWRYTGVPVIFSDAGRVIDGQHRLRAVMASGASIQSDVKFGAPDEAFLYIDSGKKRTGGDIFAINGIKNYTHSAAITKFVAGYLMSPNDRDGSRNLIITSAELLSFYQSSPDIQDGVPIYSKFRKNRLAQPAVMAGLYVIFARKCRRDAERFFGIVIEGFGASSKNDPALVLHRKMIEAATSGTPLSRLETIGLTIGAWNRMRDGLSGRGLKYDHNEKMPRAR